MKGFVTVATVADFADGAIKVVEVSGNEIVLFKVAGQVYAVENNCPHAGYTLHDGVVEGKVVTCLLHGAEFDVTTGECAGGLPCDNIDSYDVKVSDDGTISICVDR